MRRKILILIGQADGLGSAINTRQVFQQAEMNGIMAYALSMKLPDPPGPVVEARNRIPPEARAPLPMGTLQTGTTDVQNGNYAPTVAEMYEIVRGLIAIVEIWTLNGIPAVICAMISTRAKRIGDLAAGTYVVREETAMKLAPAPWMPPALIPWATGADMAALPDGDRKSTRLNSSH